MESGLDAIMGRHKKQKVASSNTNKSFPPPTPLSLQPPHYSDKSHHELTPLSTFSSSSYTFTYLPEQQQQQNQPQYQQLTHYDIGDNNGYYFTNNSLIYNPSPSTTPASTQNTYIQPQPLSSMSLQMMTPAANSQLMCLNSSSNEYASVYSMTTPVSKITTSGVPSSNSGDVSDGDGGGGTSAALVVGGNGNERTRLISINEAFEILRFHIPTFPYERRLSKIDTLHLAISYISLLESVIESNMTLYDYLKAFLDGTLDFNKFNRAGKAAPPPTWATSGIISNRNRKILYIFQ